MPLHPIVVVLLCLVQVPTPVVAPVDAAADGYTQARIEAALARLDVDAKQVRIAPHDLNLFDRQPPRSPLLDWLVASPLKAPLLLGYFDESFRIETPAGCVKALSRMSRWGGKTVRRGLIGDPLERAKAAVGGDEPLVTAIQRVFSVGGGVADEQVLAELQRSAKDVPLEERKTVATLLHTMCDAHQWVEIALEPLPTTRWDTALTQLLESDVDEDGQEPPPFDTYREVRDVTRAIIEFDTALPLVGAQEIAFAVRDLRDVYDRDDPPTWSLSVDTPLGLISIGSEHNVTDWKAAPLLLIDWKGDDAYPVAAATDGAKRRVSVAIDFDGNDQYVNDQITTGNFAAGHCGIGMLFDFAGDDEYAVPRNGLSQALFGVSVLFDAAGTDRYAAVEKAQGFAFAGTALLVDIEGNDTYDIYKDGQGNGQPGGVGVLADLAGDDVYTANDTDIRFPSPQSAKHNVSMAQGAGHGWRGDYRQGLSVPGGVGVLYDGGGNDAYTCGIFGQGVGYWFGSGILIDRHGNDSYTGQWYAQGASAHFAAGLLIEGDGDDRYDAQMNMAQGAGHDVGVGLLADLAGNDEYIAGTLSLGAGNSSGIGVFIDCVGSDRYDNTRGTNNMGYATPNHASSIRSAIPGIGLFLELGGVDTYPPGRMKNDDTWSSEPGEGATVVPGIGRGIDLNGTTSE